MIERHASRVLDVGCGSGENARYLRDLGHVVTAVTMSPIERDLLIQQGIECILADCREGLPLPKGHYDVVLMSHVLEHIDWPEAAILNLKPHLRPGGYFLCAVPNVMFFRSRLILLRGDFPRENAGVFDKTHLRWFNWGAPFVLARESGCELRDIEGDAWFRKIWWLPKVIGRMLVRIRPNLFSQQIRFKLLPL
jgi:SAM-dependent methyltransferase